MASGTSMIQRYMQEVYPVEQLWKLLSLIGPPQNREFAFFFKRIDTEGERDYIQRNKSFDTPQELSAYVEKKKPFRIEIGGVYTIKPRLRYLYQKESAWIYTRELIFDIDIDGYDHDARSCCTGKSEICPSCWPLVSIAACILDIGLLNLGIRKRAWFFTGGRGLHCIVFDAQCACANREYRTAIVQQLLPTDVREWYTRALRHCDSYTRTIISWLCLTAQRFNRTANLDHYFAGKQNKNITNLFFDWYVPRHPFLAMNALRKSAVGHISQTHRMAILIDSCCKDASDIAERLSALRSVRETRDGDITIEDLLVEPREFNKKVDELKDMITTSIDENFDPIVCNAALTLMLPRIDANVTLDKSHLLRAPFGVHASSMRLGTHVPTRNLMTFRPSDSPVLVTEQGVNDITFNDIKKYRTAVVVMQELITSLCK